MSDELRRTPSIIPAEHIPPHEQEIARNKGIDISQGLVDDLSSRLEEMPGVPPDQVNKLGLQEARGEGEDDSLVAAAIRETLEEDVNKAMSEQEIERELEEGPLEEVEETPPTAQNSAPAKESDEDQSARLIAEAIKQVEVQRQNERREKYKKRITPELRDAVLEAAITGTVYQSTYELLNKRLTVVVGSVSYTLERILPRIGEKLTKDLEDEPRQRYIADIQQVSRLVEVRYKDKVLYAMPAAMQDEDVTEADVQSAVEAWQAARLTDVVRRLCFDACQDAYNLLQIVLEEASEEGFTSPVHGDIG